MEQSITKQTILLFSRKINFNAKTTLIINTEISIRLKITKLRPNISFCIANFELLDDEIVIIRWILRFVLPTINTEKLPKFLINFANWYLRKDIIQLSYGIWTPQISSYHHDIDSVIRKLKSQNEKFKVQIKQLANDMNNLGIIILNKDIFKLPEMENFENIPNMFEIDLNELQIAQRSTILSKTPDICWICRRTNKFNTSISESEGESFDTSSNDEVFTD